MKPSLILRRNVCWAVTAGLLFWLTPAPRSGGETNTPPVAAAASTNGLAKLAESAPATNSSSDRTNTVARTDFSSFRLISDRNIFNPSRSARSASGRTETEPRKVIKIENLSLVGTLSYEKGDLAFFDGSSSQFKTVAKPEDSIAGFKVQKIGFKDVSLVRDGKVLTVPVGGKLRRQDEGEWELVSSTEKSSSEVAAATSGDSASGGDSGSSDGAESDVLKRLLQKREQEMKNEKQ